MNYRSDYIITDGKTSNYLAGMIGGRHSATKREDHMKFETFGERLFWARRHLAQLTQIDLRNRMAENSGVEIGANYISQLETGGAENRPSFEVVSAMAAELKVSLDWFAGFTGNYEPGRLDDTPPNYFSQEADEVARAVDGMRPEQRALVLNLVKSMVVAPSERQRERSEIVDMLNSIERQRGRNVRREIEQILRSKGIPIDPTS